MNDARPTLPRALVVDDDRDFARLVAERLKALGLQAETATSILTALAIIGIQPPQLICLDVNMPTGNGLGVGQLLAADPIARRIPVVFLTGCKDVGTIRRCGELGGHYVHKSPRMWPRFEALVCGLAGVEPPAPEVPFDPSQEAEEPALSV